MVVLQCYSQFSGQEWQFHIATDHLVVQEWQLHIVTDNPHGKEWQFHIATDLYCS